MTADCSYLHGPGGDFLRFGNTWIPLLDVFEITGVLKGIANPTIHN
jgi:hypothetical protein